MAGNLSIIQENPDDSQQKLTSEFIDENGM